MTLPTAGIVSLGRSLIEQTFTSPVSIRRNNTAGSWPVVATEMCYFSQAPILPQENPSETQRLFIDDRWRFKFMAGTDIRFQDRIEVEDGRLFEVIQVPVGTIELYRLAIAQELGA